MHEVIKKSIEDIEICCRTKYAIFAKSDLYDKQGNSIDGDKEYLEMVDGIKQQLINSHITLAEEKIKELEGEKKTATSKDGIDVLRVGYNQAKQEEIDKWKQFISELKQL